MRTTGQPFPLEARDLSHALPTVTAPAGGNNLLVRDSRMEEPVAVDWVFGFGSIMNNLSRAATSGDADSTTLLGRVLPAHGLVPTAPLMHPVIRGAGAVLELPVHHGFHSCRAPVPRPC